MSRIFIINAGASFFHSKGELNHAFADVAAKTLKAQGHEVITTHVTEGYNIAEEIDHYLWADIVIYQQPAWWMGTPWQLKKYLDEVLTHGHGKLYTSDGRVPENPTRHYGTGGLLKNKQYMISCTWNAPIEAFTLSDEFFEGKGVDAVYFPFHKLNQFIGMTPLPTFSAHDVIKNASTNDDFQRYEAHLLKHIK